MAVVSLASYDPGQRSLKIKFSLANSHHDGYKSKTAMITVSSHWWS